MIGPTAGTGMNPGSVEQVRYRPPERAAVAAHGLSSHPRPSAPLVRPTDEAAGAGADRESAGGGGSGASRDAAGGGSP